MEDPTFVTGKSIIFELFHFINVFFCSRLRPPNLNNSTANCGIKNYIFPSLFTIYHCSLPTTCCFNSSAVRSNKCLPHTHHFLREMTELLIINMELFGVLQVLGVLGALGDIRDLGVLVI